jgi:hypothetical protein
VVALTTTISAGPIRDQAAVSVTFDGVKTDGTLPVAVGKRQFSGRLINGVTAEASPFWAQQAKQALHFSAAKKQSVQLTDVPYLDRPDAVSLSFFFLNLHNVNDAASHGIVAKRSADNRGTNYGINYNLKNDTLQLYVNDGSGFRVATYSARSVLGYRRLVHLTATFEVADAPAPDADGDRDDLLIRLFMNGKQVKPTKVEKGAVAGSDAWLLDIIPAALLNDAPLTIGASTPATEFASCLIDEFLLYSRALTPAEAGALFYEVAGANADALARQESEVIPPEPAIRLLSLNGLQLGTTTRLTITGSGLAPNPRVDLPIASFDQKVVKGSTPGRLIVELTIPAETKPGYYPLRVQTENGLSNALSVALDELPERTLADTSLEKPAALPAAFSGTISGSQVARIYFRGKAGERVVADVEARRIGARLDPVLEIKTDRGTPLAIEWGKVFLKGDTRAVVKLPADGLYYAELHDLSYKAPGQNSFRLVLGDLQLVDSYFPMAVARGAGRTVELVGTGIPPGTVARANAAGGESGRVGVISLPPSSTPHRATPPLRVSDAVEVVETAAVDGKLQRVDARFAKNKHVPLVINGRISQPNEEDVYLLDVTPGQPLSLRIDARSIDSPLDARLAVKVNRAVQAVADDRPGSRDPAFTFNGVEQIQLTVRDLYGRGGPHYLYRLRVIPAGQPDFSLRVTTQKLSLPADGTGLLRLELNRAGFNGPVKLTALGVAGVSITPQQIPAGGGNRKLMVTLLCSGDKAQAGLQQLRIIGESVGLPNPIRRLAVVTATAGQVVVPGFEDSLPTALTRPVGLQLKVKQTPQVLLKALAAQVSVELDRGAGNSSRLPVRLTLVSSEAKRRVDPKNAGKGSKPQVRALPGQILPTGANSGPLNIAVPVDVAESSIEFVVRGDVLPHAYSQRILATVYSQPFRLPVQAAVGVAIDAKTLNLIGETQNKVTGTITRAKQFQGDVVLAIVGLPKGFSAAKVTVPPDSKTFEIVVTAPKANEKRPIGKITFTVTDKSGRVLQPTRNLAVTVSPKPAKK